MVDQRKSKRFKIYQLINVSFGKEDFLPCEGVNLSETGMLVRLNDEIEYHTRIFILFEIPMPSGEKHEISCDANVVHCKKAGEQFEIGIAFNIVRLSDKQKLKQYFENLQEV